jgi:hypothetical protein
MDVILRKSENCGKKDLGKEPAAIKNVTEAKIAALRLDYEKEEQELKEN